MKAPALCSRVGWGWARERSRPMGGLGGNGRSLGSADTWGQQLPQVPKLDLRPVWPLSGQVHVGPGRGGVEGGKIISLNITFKNYSKEGKIKRIKDRVGEGVISVGHPKLCSQVVLPDISSFQGRRRVPGIWLPRQGRTSPIRPRCAQRRQVSQVQRSSPWPLPGGVAHPPTTPGPPGGHPQSTAGSSHRPVPPAGPRSPPPGLQTGGPGVTGARSPQTCFPSVASPLPGGEWGLAQAALASLDA